MNTHSLFVSYSHKDESYKDALRSHLSALERSRLITEWNDRKIVPGKRWEKEIDEAMGRSSVILLLVSSDFIASDYCFGKEMTVAMERHEAGRSIVIPVLIRSCKWSDAPFAALQALPKDAIPVSTWSDKDTAWMQVVEGIQTAIADLDETHDRRPTTGGFRDIKSYLADEIESINVAFERNVDDGAQRGLSTGLSNLDSLTDGLHESELVVLAGRPSMRVSDLVAQIAAHVAVGEKRGVAYLSLSMPADRLMRRMMCSIGGLEPVRLVRGNLSEHDWPRVASAITLLNQNPLFIDDTFEMDVGSVYDHLNELCNAESIGLVVVDGANNLNPDDRTESRFENITMGLKRIARDFKVTVLMTNALSPKLERRPNKRPVFFDLDKWRCLEELADTVIFVFNPDAYSNSFDHHGVTELIVAKNFSDGGLGSVRVALDHSQTFIPLTD